ncbi:MAG: hypothetical protein DRN08_03385 [Thermoplasmata archaeon]|nr:MAG: hypothetical protein DRN08_03385 [Thermoplasmata archaeon]
MRTIMIVDDEPEILEKVRSCLEDNEFDVVTALNSRQALEVLQSDEEEKNIDLILVDTHMPGTEKKSAFFPVKPNSKAKDSEISNFLEKPFTKKQLLDFVKNNL